MKRWKKTSAMIAAVFICSIVLVCFIGRMLNESEDRTIGGFMDAGKMVCKITMIPVAGKTYSVRAEIMDRGPNSDEYVRNTMDLVSQYFEVLEWPEEQTVEFLETRDLIVVTWPVHTELLNVPYRGDFTLRVEIDKTQKRILRVIGG